jgi:hypothetical protein
VTDISAGDVFAVLPELEYYLPKRNTVRDRLESQNWIVTLRGREIWQINGYRKEYALEITDTGEFFEVAVVNSFSDGMGGDCISLHCETAESLSDLRATIETLDQVDPVKLQDDAQRVDETTLEVASQGDDPPARSTSYRDVSASADDSRKQAAGD